MSDKWNREVLASMCEKIAEQTKEISPESDYEETLLVRMRIDAEDNADWFRESDR